MATLLLTTTPAIKRRQTYPHPITIPFTFPTSNFAVLFLLPCSLQGRAGKGMSCHVSPLLPLYTSPPMPCLVLWDHHAHPAALTVFWGCAGSPVQGMSGFVQAVVCCVVPVLLGVSHTNLGFHITFTLQVSSCKHAVSALQMQNPELLHLESSIYFFFL